MRENSFIDKFNTHISENRLFRNTETILLAVSGGIDSVVMAELFYQCKLNFGIAHCNFQLRDEDSNADEKFAKEIAEKYDVAFYDKRFDTIKFQKENKLSLEEAARILRYEWLEGIRSAFNYNFIATAHHINDSIETIILNLTKGTGIRGLKGIPVKNGFVVRPLLFAAREEIEIFAKENNLQYRTDKTNLNNDFQRNKIRNLVIPVLKEINPALEKTFHKNIKHFIDAELLYKEQIEKKVKKLLDRRKDAIYIPINTLKTLPASATYLFEIVKQFNFSDDQSEEVHENLFGSGKQFFSSTHRLIVDRKFLIITSVNTEDSKHIIIEKDNKHVTAKNFILHLEYSKIASPIKFNDSGNIAYFDTDKISFPLTLRVWKKGDYFYPIGMYKKPAKTVGGETNPALKPAKKKVSDVLTNMKVNLHEKENTFVLLNDDRIIWLVGLRQDERFKVSKNTKHLLKIKMLPG